MARSAACPRRRLRPVVGHRGRRGREPGGGEGHVEEAGTGHLDAREPRRRSPGSLRAGARRSPRRSRAAGGAADSRSAIATGLARSPISAWAGAASGTAGGSAPDHGAGGRGQGGRISMKWGASATDGELTEPLRPRAARRGGRSPAAGRGRCGRPRPTGPTRLTVREYDGRAARADDPARLRRGRTAPANGWWRCSPACRPTRTRSAPQIYGGPERRVVEGDGRRPRRAASR